MATPEILALDNTHYLIHPEILGKPPPSEDLSSEGTKAITLLSFNGQIDLATLRDIPAKFSSIDDVFSGSFLATLLIQTPYGVEIEPRLERDDVEDLWQTESAEVLYSVVETAKDLLPPGPYFLNSQGIHQAWRLYPDTLDAFMFAVISESCSKPSNFLYLNTFQNGLWREIAVPSRLYHTVTAEKPLAGARISIKDNFQLSGIKTSMTSRPFLDLYTEETESAAYVYKLIELGAVIIGKSKMTSYASGEEPTDQWIDFHCPFCPRGDLYQSPGGSTTGGGAGLAGYPWLEYSIGTDTAGSIRVPSSFNGLFGLRSSWGSGNLRGVYEAASAFDTIGLLSRDVKSMHKLAKLTLTLPAKILYPKEFFPLEDPQQEAMVEEFVKILESFLEVERTCFSFVEKWDEDPPLEANGKGLKHYLENSAFHHYYYDFFHAFDSFRDSYQAMFGQEAYISPLMRFRWYCYFHIPASCSVEEEKYILTKDRDLGRQITPEERRFAAVQLSVYRKWFQEHIMTPDPDCLSDAILILPHGPALPKYRDDPNTPWVLQILGENTIAMVLQLPQLVAPIGQNAYESRVSGRTEYRPICGSIVGANGSDLLLIDIVGRAMEAAGWPTCVETGRLTFPVGDNVRNVASKYC